MAKSRKLIKHIEELPKTFDLKNYAFAKQFNARDWAKALLVRTSMNSWDRDPNVEVTAMMREFFDSFFEDPQIIHKYDLFFQEPGLERKSISWNGGEFPFWMVDNLIDNPPLKHLIVKDMYELMFDFSSRPEYELDAKEVEFATYEHCHNQAEKLISESAENFRSMKLDSEYSMINWATTKIFLSVDTSYTDEILIEEFKKRLAERRVEREIEPRHKNYTETELARWCRLGVLPYLDLSFWAASTGFRISQNVMGKALFPNYHDIDRTQAIRQTVKPLASALLESSAVRVLWAQGEAEKG